MRGSWSAPGAAGWTHRRQPLREHNYDAVVDLVRRRVAETKGRISAKRLLSAVRAEGYDGSDRNFRRVVAAAKGDWPDWTGLSAVATGTW